MLPNRFKIYGIFSNTLQKKTCFKLFHSEFANLSCLQRLLQGHTRRLLEKLMQTHTGELVDQIMASNVLLLPRGTLVLLVFLSDTFFCAIKALIAGSGRFWAILTCR